MRRPFAVLALVTLAAGLSGCGEDEADPAVPSSSSAAIVAPSRSVTSSTTAPVVPSEQSPASTAGPTATPTTAAPPQASSASPDASGGASSATAGAGPSPGLGNATSCGDVHFDETSDNAAWEISATGISCAQAVALVKQVSQQHNFVTGPRQFSTDGWACTVTTTEDGMPQGAYGCRKGAALVSWDRT